MERVVLIHCAWCGCEDASVIPADGAFPPQSRAWRVITRENSLLRSGGCEGTCCHEGAPPDAARLVVTVQAPRNGDHWPTRPTFDAVIHKIDYVEENR